MVAKATILVYLYISFNQQEIMEILLKNGYKRTNVSNQFITKDKVAVVSKLGDVYITSYTPVHKRFLDCEVVNQKDLENHFKK